VSATSPARGRRILITGIAGTLGGKLARELEQIDEVEEIIGVDVHEPSLELSRTEFLRADLRNPLVARVVTTTEVDTVVHLSTVATPGEVGGRSKMKEQNVIGVMQLLAACQKAPKLRHLVLKSTAAVYGSNFKDPAMFREEHSPSQPATSGFGKDATEIEGYVRGFGRHRPDTTVTVLRFANFLGGEMDSVLGSFFTLPVVPSVLGYDPRLQFVHEEDGVEILRRAVVEEHAGIYNVAGPGQLYLSQCVRLAGRVQIPVPLPLVSAVAGMVRRSKRVDFSPEQLRFLQFGRGMDITRLVENFGYTPEYSTREAFEDFLGRRRIRAILRHDDVVRWERDLYDFLQRKGQERFMATRRDR